MDDRKRSPNHTPRGQGWWVAAGARLFATLIHDRRQAVEHSRATLQDRRSTTRSLDHAQARRARFGIKVLQQVRERISDTVAPATLTLIPEAKLCGEALQLSIQCGQQACFTVGELFVEGAPRHPGLSTHATYRQARNTVLTDDFTDGEQ